MSVVGLKNVVVSLASKVTNNNNIANSSPPLLSQSSSNYGTNTLSTDLESGSSMKNGLDRSNLQDQDINNHHHLDEDSTTDLDYFHQQHTHTHFWNKIFGEIDPRVISDLIIGLSDGLTVPFALTAGLSSLGDSKLVITGGFAELISGAISMGLGGYLGAKSESDYYYSEIKKQKKIFINDSMLVNHEVEDILMEINPDFSNETILSFIKDLQKQPELMVDFIIRYGKGLDEPAENRQLISAITIGGGYFFGGVIPLLPYFFVTEVGKGLFYSIIVMAITLFWFGIFKSQMSMGADCPIKKQTLEGIQMVAVGGVAAGAAWYFVKLLG
ncbi:hypothetical protein TBLA_0I02590 [Henningerozyma blattae CBS 6284]|uniref:Protein CCC1 n=1 Tax=Henningerozyma blattae (strain ATCC 34711 / CBS 6284 / DSM 70876 / NBRC 10599 / NRRL Y-10934 / UCD 77-7) TaxID=1071380 RepID=I2H963_HENB6|nr:hypothetical protein TBLA_0I02590 [Tetrapisispora blattae CBS 6284]CCH62915.1 hypothetical protein TBLA_0I02590 [Tetrapisispora blattae CBS 6284]